HSSEPCSAHQLGLIVPSAALELLPAIGIEAISAELQRKRAWLVPALQAKRYKVLQADAPAANTSSIVSFFKPGADLPAVHQRLIEQNIITSLRADRSGQRYIRLSPHFYNTD